MKHLLPALALSLLLPACAETPGITSHLTPYRIDVRQGNMVTQDMVAQLKPGLSRDQVRFILGTPLVTDMFHTDRWDYVYRFKPGRGEVEQRRLVVYFDEDNKLLRLDGDIVANQPAGSDAPAKPASRVIDIPAAETAVPAVVVPAETAAPAK
jgi:outer membrane protein assembly factor BamE